MQQTADAGGQLVQHPEHLGVLAGRQQLRRLQGGGRRLPRPRPQVLQVSARDPSARRLDFVDLDSRVYGGAWACSSAV